MGLKLILMAFLFLLVPLTSAQTTVVLDFNDVLDDAVVKCDDSSGNFGGFPYFSILTTGSFGSSVSCYEGLVKFDLSSIPVGQEIVSAELGLRIVGLKLVAGQEMSVDVRRVLPSYSWDEGSVSFDSKPVATEFSVSGDSVSFDSGDGFQMYYWDVSGLVGDAYNDGVVSFYLSSSVVSGTFDSSHFSNLGSSENSNPDRRPVLVIEYQPVSSSNPGDVNGDLMVDVNDLIFMTMNLGSSGFDPRADINSDGTVNIFDLVVVARNYGNDYSGGSCECSGSSCQVGGTGLVCDGCNYVTAPSEVCGDSIDNDCDGTPDDGCVSCSCGGWADNVCGAGVCGSNQMQQTRSCNPSACQVETQCVVDMSCSSPICGSNGCEAGETCSSCPGDCGACGSGPIIYFASDWSTDTGIGLPAILDSDKLIPWSSSKALGDGTEVVPASATGFVWPAGMQNVLQIKNLAAGSPNQGLKLTEQLPIPAVGESRFERFYFAYTTPNWYTEDPQNHPFDGGPGGGSSINNRVFHTYNGDDMWWPDWGQSYAGFGSQFRTFVLGPRLSASESPPGIGASGSYPLQKNKVYMFEYELRRINLTHFRPYIWVSDVLPDGSTVQIYDPNDWYIKSNEGFSMADEVRDFPFGDINYLVSQNIGSNGWSSDPPTDYVAWYWGGVAFCAERCGPYVLGEGS